jgi:hypothetical protein
MVRLPIVCVTCHPLRFTPSPETLFRNHSWTEPDRIGRSVCYNKFKILALRRTDKLKSSGLYLNLDDAWDNGVLGLQEHDLRNWGPRLRYCAPRSIVESFYREIEDILTPFVLHGSGDFHYLTTLFLRKMTMPVTIVSFDNHPDWDRRPPHWSCGGWTVRALAGGAVEQVNIWGCGNFELRFPHCIFADFSSLRSGRLVPYAWAERQTSGVCRRFNCITRMNWKEKFSEFADAMNERDIYITVDMDCLRTEDAVTNWENGLFSSEDLAWALTLLHDKTNVVGGDVCGAYSLPVYDRLTQRIAGRWDHPKINVPDETSIRKINLTSLGHIWPALLSGNNS